MSKDERYETLEIGFVLTYVLIDEPRQEHRDKLPYLASAVSRAYYHGSEIARAEIPLDPSLQNVTQDVAEITGRVTDTLCMIDRAGDGRGRNLYRHEMQRRTLTADTTRELATQLDGMTRRVNELTERVNLQNNSDEWLVQTLARRLESAEFRALMYRNFGASPFTSSELAAAEARAEVRRSSVRRASSSLGLLTEQQMNERDAARRVGPTALDAILVCPGCGNFAQACTC